MKNTFKLGTLISIVVLTLSLSAANHPQKSDADDWYRWRGPMLNGVSQETNWNPKRLLPEPSIKWTVDIGVGFSSVVVNADSVFTIGHVDEQDIISCIDVNSGRTKWTFAYSAPLEARDFEGGPTSTPTIDGDRLYVLSRAGDLFCFLAKTGELVWKIQAAEVADVRIPGWGFSASPLVIEDMVIVNIGEHGAAFNKRDGSLIWNSPDKESGYATPVPVPGAEKPTAVFASGRAFVGVNYQTGEQLWNERWLTSFGCNAADAIVDHGRMFLSSGYNRGGASYKFIDGKPELVWKNKEMQNQLHGSILFEGFLYGIDGDMESGANLKCMNFETGEVAWSEPDLRPGGLALAGGRLLVLSESGDLLIAEAKPNEFCLLSQAKILDGKCWTVPVLAHGRIYCRSIQGQLSCVDLRE